MTSTWMRTATVLAASLLTVTARAEVETFLDPAGEAGLVLLPATDESLEAQVDAIFAAAEEALPPAPELLPGDAAAPLDADYCVAGGGYGCDACGCYRTAPNMIGDSIGVPIVIGNGANFVGAARHFLKVGENNNVLPMSRVGFGYNYFSNVPATWNSLGRVQQTEDIHEFKLLVEKAFANDRVSFNVILPFYQTIGFEQPLALFPNYQDDGEFGNLGFGMKALLHRTASSAMSAGMLVEAPTADDYQLFGTGVENSEWFLTPYAAFQYTPNDHLFATTFVSYRFRTGSNAISNSTDTFIQSERLMIDSALGFWLFRHRGGRCLTGLAPTVELHYTTYTEDQAQFLYTSIFINRVDLLNLTAGITAELAHGGTLVLAAVAPLRSNPYRAGGLQTDRSFDAEFVAQYNFYF